MNAVEAREYLINLYILGRRAKQKLHDFDPDISLCQEWANTALSALKVIETISNPLYRVFLIERYINRSTVKWTFEYMGYESSGGFIRRIQRESYQAFADAFENDVIFTPISGEKIET